MRLIIWLKRAIVIGLAAAGIWLATTLIALEFYTLGAPPWVYNGLSSLSLWIVLTAAFAFWYLRRRGSRVVNR